MSSKLPSYMRPEQEKGTAPQFNIGQQVEAVIDSIEEVTGQYGKQLQFALTLQPSGWGAKAWVKYYPVPQPNQHLGKLCLSIERITGQTFSTLQGAIDAVKSYGRIYVSVKGFREVKGDDGTTRSYPNFSIFPDILPGEQMGQTQVTQPQAQQMEPVTNIHTPALENANVNSLSTAAYLWLTVSQELIGKQIPDTDWNKIRASGVVSDLAKYTLIEMKDDLPYLSEEARKYL